MSIVTAVLFDVDETLYDRPTAQIAVLAAMRREMEPLFGSLTEKRVVDAWSRSDRETEDHVFTTSNSIRESRNHRSRIFLELLGIDPEQADAITDYYVENYPKMRTPVEGAPEVVARCAKRVPTGVVSNAFPDVQYRKLDAIGLGSVFACVVLSEDFGARKPNPAVLLEGCRQLRSDPAATLYVGDSFANDVVGSRSAGMIPVWFNPTSKPVPPGETAPEHELYRLSQLLDLLPTC
ncbi:MAG: HAD family hydrolase [Candidatus Latescibacterota bacterium]|nr:HAD family hydrolase [Candidatus Latescibacterota bacterium]